MRRNNTKFNVSMQWKILENWCSIANKDSVGRLGWVDLQEVETSRTCLWSRFCHRQVLYRKTEGQEKIFCIISSAESNFSHWLLLSANRIWLRIGVFWCKIAGGNVWLQDLSDKMHTTKVKVTNRTETETNRRKIAVIFSRLFSNYLCMLFFYSQPGFRAVLHENKSRSNINRDWNLDKIDIVFGREIWKLSSAFLYWIFSTDFCSWSTLRSAVRIKVLRRIYARLYIYIYICYMNESR